MPTDVIFFSSTGQIREYLGSSPEKNIANQKLNIYMSADFAHESSGFDPVEKLQSVDYVVLILYKMEINLL